MKKLIYCVAALATMFFAGSCQQENLEPAAKGNTVTYTVEAPMDVQTKAIGNGLNVNKVIYEVWHTSADGTTKLVGEGKDPKAVKLYQSSEDMVVIGEPGKEVNRAVITLDLLADQHYTILFWAQVDGTGVYNTTELTAVTYNDLNAEAYAANDERLAAFYAVDFINDGVARNSRVTLTRPFAQVNLGTLNSKAEAKENDYKIDLKQSRMILDAVPTVFNTATDEVSGYQTMTFAFHNVPAVKAEDATLTVNDTPYQYAGMNYVFAGANVSLTYDIKVSLNGSEEYATVNNTVPQVPVKRNYRTNIVGNLLTSKTEYEVVVDARFNEPAEDIVLVDTPAELQKAIDAASATEEITLDGDVNFSELFEKLTKAATEDASFVTVPPGKEVTLNLNGYSITGVDQTHKNFGLIQNNGKLTIKNTSTTVSKMSLVAEHNDGWNRYSAVISNNPGAELTVESNVVIEHLGGTDMAYGIDNLTNSNIGAVKATVDGATVTSTYRAIRQFLNSDSTMNELTITSGSTIRGAENNKAIFFQDPSAKSNKGKLTIEEGARVSGVYLYVCEGSTEWPVEVSIAASSIAEGYEVVSANVPKGYSVKEVDGIWTVEFHPVAKIGEKGYVTLADAVAAVQDGETITLVADETFTATNYYNNGGWKDGLGYSGDKSFTIDLGGYTIKQDGSLNDYLVWIKNDGAKANTITFKNGTMDAGTTAYCAIATASTNAQKLTVNLENINLINNISNGAVVKARGGSELNVKAGTVITGKNSYTGIEAAGNNTIVNVYEGAEIYQNGTSSYVGAIAGASQNATLNIYGGKGKSAKCGIIVMSTGATVNVSGGEWTSNVDGTVAADNQAVLVCQNNRYESSWACKSILNVTGGTFKGGFNCYGMGPGVEADDAQINIKGGNFNANPANYVVAGYEVTENAGTYTVDKPAALKELEAALANGGNVTLTKDVTLLESIKIENNVVLDLNGKTITAPLFSAFEVKAGGELTVKNGKVVAYESTVRAIGGKVIIESGEYTSTGTALDSPATYRYSLDCREGGELIINGGTFKSNNGLINVGSTVTINGGKFENIVEKTMTRHLAYVSALLTINDGEFYGKANSSAGGCFFCGAAKTCDIQVIGGKFTSLWTSGSVNRIFESYAGGSKINVTGGMFNTNGGIATFVTENTDEATKAAYPYVAK